LDSTGGAKLDNLFVEVWSRGVDLNRNRLLIECKLLILRLFTIPEFHNAEFDG